MTYRLSHAAVALWVWAAFASNATAAVEIPCVGVDTELSKAAVIQSDTAFRASWRDASPNWFTTFEVKAPKRNPFDLTETPTAEPIRGTTWAHGIYCLANLSPDKSEVLVRYYARVTSFHEGQTWSKPVLEGLLQSFLVKKVGDTWQTKVLTVDQAIVLPQAILRQPDVATIPPANAKLGIPCGTGQVWNGSACVAARAPSAKAPAAKPAARN
jgi:hypothetical protein